MKINKVEILAWAGSVGLIFLVFFAGCQTQKNQVSKPEVSVAELSRSKKGGAQLWSESCMRCHNARSPSWYSDADWEVTMQHMRVRANLTAEEQKKILEFLQSGN